MSSSSQVSQFFSGCESTFLEKKSTLSGGNLNKTHIFEFGSSYLASARTIISLVRPWFFFGSSLVFYSIKTAKVQGTGILRKRLFRISNPKCQFCILNYTLYLTTEKTIVSLPNDLFWLSQSIE